MKNKNKTILLSLGIFLALALISINNVSAIDYCFLKLKNGEKIHISETDYYTCTHTTCQVCTNSQGWYAAWNKCSNLCPETPENEPDLTLNADFPFSDGGVFTKQSFFLDITTNKIAGIYLINNVAGPQKNLCPNCRKYKKSATFKAGFNDITIRAVKGSQIQEKRITFYIDNKKPVISKTLPMQNKYASSLFSVYYTEDNVKEINIYYGTEGNIKSKKLDNCLSGKNQFCSIDVDLKEFDGKQIRYWFEIRDIANNVVLSRNIKIYVDETSPVINSLNYNIYKSYVTFNASITEKNLDKLFYFDNSDEKGKVLCTGSSLKNGLCIKKLTFKKGHHAVQFRAVDKAGNFAFQNIEFDIA